MENNQIIEDYDDEFESFDYKFRKLHEARSDFSGSCNLTAYQTNGSNDVIQQNNSNDLLKGQLCSNKLSRHFFSKCNVDHLQNLIIQNVYKLSNKKIKIGRQSDRELFIIMRHFYFNYSSNNDDYVIEHVNELNNLIVKKVLPKLLSNITQYNAYLQKINNPLQLIDHPINVNNSGSRGTLPGRELF